MESEFSEGRGVGEVRNSLDVILPVLDNKSKVLMLLTHFLDSFPAYMYEISFNMYAMHITI